MSRGARLISKLLPILLFPLVILAIGAYMFASSFGQKFVTAAFAGAFGGILVVLSAALLLRDIRRGFAKPSPRPDSAPTEADQHTPSLIVPLAWCAGFVVAMFLIGLLWAIPAWMFVFLLWHRASRVYTLVAPVVLWAIMKFGVEVGLETVLFEGILFGGKPPHFW
jgi:hypothetical protein